MEYRKISGNGGAVQPGMTAGRNIAEEMDREIEEFLEE